MSTWRPRYYDIGVNFSDGMFQGRYHGSHGAKHPCDINQVIERAHLFNVDKMLITASNIQESEDHFALCEQYSNNFDSTTGVHPCTVAQEFYIKDDNGNYTDTLREDVDEKLTRLKEIAIKGYELGHVKAFGEIGLDYDRLHYSNKHQQCEMFKRQLDVHAELKHLQLPLFLHMRAACDDFISILKPYIENGSIIKGNGVVHSFTGTEDELAKILDLGFYIGINGCSLKTEENLIVASKIPIDRLLIETDAPWCEIRKSHASYKYITPYPNKFYPEIKPIHENSPQPESEVVTASKRSKSENNGPVFKLDVNLPFPSIKKEYYGKHKEFTQKQKENSARPELVETRFGPLAHPLFKSRNEPVYVGFVAEILCELHGIKDEKEIESFIDLIFENSCKLFKTNY
ncbi:pi038 [[Candida] subhashii]|uniref:Pi038 n=1 Tax=[Candida] subhashii TaxID=561895 RepID=A0A8J5QQM0_9ASCO|nr:pi038 [[Candida] subhashii]KAG7664901.1 pi038 [[Candida] subhashii]